MVANIRFFSIDRAVANCLDLVLLAVAIILEFQPGRRFIHSPFLYGVLLQQWYVKNIVDRPLFW